jgi:mRNA interferase MazF
MVGKIPEQGDIVWVRGGEGVGHEQSGTRPALILSEYLYNKKTGCSICCLLTRKTKGYVTEVFCHVEGEDAVILVDQIRLVDYKERKIKFITKAKKETLQEVKDKIKVLLSL